MDHNSDFLKDKFWLDVLKVKKNCDIKVCISIFYFIRIYIIFHIQQVKKNPLLCYFKINKPVKTSYICFIEIQR